MPDWLALPLGWTLVAVGAVMAPLPPPFAFGVPLFVVGAALLLSRSRRFRRLIQAARAAWPGLSRRLATARRLPKRTERLLRRTDPAPLLRLRRRRVS